MSKDEKTDEAPPKKSKKMLIIILAVVLLAGGGGGAAFFLMKGPSKKPAPVPGKVVPMDAVTVNLADGHYLKLKIALQATAAAAETPDGSQAIDIAIAQFSNMTVGELASTAAMQKQKKVLTAKVVKAYPTDEVMDVYFTEFVMQ